MDFLQMRSTEQFPRSPPRLGVPVLPKLQLKTLGELHDALPRGAITYRPREGETAYRDTFSLDSLPRVRLATPYVSPYAEMRRDTWAAEGPFPRFDVTEPAVSYTVAFGARCEELTTVIFFVI